MSRLLSVVKAEYDYTASSHDELTIHEDDVLFVLDDNDTEWWKVRPRLPASAPAETAPDEGLVPRTYVTQLPPLREVFSLYDYDAQNDEELSVQEDEKVDLFEEDGDWSLCGKLNVQTVGWLPTAWLQNADEVDQDAPEAAAPAAVTVPPPPPPPAPTQSVDTSNAAPTSHSQPESPTSATSKAPAIMGSAKDVKTWSVTEIDKKKKKKKGTLLVGNGAIFFTSESDKTPVQQYALSSLTSHRVEKNKHLYLEFATGAEVHFSVSKDALEEIVAKIEECSADPAGASSSSPAPAPPPSLPAAASTSPSPPQSTSSPPPPAAAPTSAPRFLPPPIRSVAPPVESSVTATNVHKTTDSPPPQPSSPASPPRQASPPPSTRAIPPPPPPSSAPPPPLPPTHPPATSSSKEPSAIVLYDFDGEASDELTVREGEKVFVLDDSSDEWWKVKRQNSSEEGVIPASYVEIDEDATTTATKDQKPASFTAAGVTASSSSEVDPELERERRERERLQRELEEERAQRKADRERRLREEEDEKAARKLQAEEDERDRHRQLVQEAERKRRKEREESEAREREKEKEKQKQKERRSKDKADRPKPSPHRIRTWKDRTGQFKVEAEFLGLLNDKIRLHKLNGVIIEVPIQKMSHDDIEHVRNATGQSLGSNSTPAPQSSSKRTNDNDDVPLSKISGNNNRLSPADSPSSNHAKHASASNKMSIQTPPNNASTPKKNMDWFEFFLNAGCDVDDCTRYAATFERDRMDESILPDTEASTLRSLGLKEGDIIRVTKHIREKYSPQPPPTPAKDEQMRQDEELARKLSESDQQQQQQQSPPSNSSGPGLFTSANGTLKSTRRGRPSRARSGSTAISADTIANASDQLQRTTLTSSPPISSPPPTNNNTNATPPNRPSMTQTTSMNSFTSSNGFEDDAWAVKKSPAPQPATSPAPVPQQQPQQTQPTPSPQPQQPQQQQQQQQQQEASTQPAATPQPVVSAQAMNEKILANLGIGTSATSTQATNPAPVSSPQTQAQSQPQQQQQQQQQPGPRGPLAPVPSNQGLLNPLVPTNSGLKPFVPTSMHPQATGFTSGPMGVTGPAASTVPMNSLVATSQPMSYQPTGFQTGGVSSPPPATMQTSMPTSMMMQPTGMMQQPTGVGMFSQPQVSMPIQSQVQVQPQQQAQQTSQATFMQNFMPNNQQQQQQQEQGSTSTQYKPENVFAQMKSGKIDKERMDNKLGPQNENKYDALRPQPTGFASGFVQQPAMTGMGFQQQVPQQQQHQMMVPQFTSMNPQQQQYPMQQQPGMPYMNNGGYQQY